MKPVQLSRKFLIERQVLALLRGGRLHSVASSDPRRSIGNLNLTDDLTRRFMALREIARRERFEIEAPECTFASSDEIKLLGWIGEGQRQRHDLGLLPLEPGLLRAIIECGLTLKATGIVLSSKAIYAGRNRHRDTQPPHAEQGVMGQAS